MVKVTMFDFPVFTRLLPFTFYRLLSTLKSNVENLQVVSLAR
jgi:hypothetical protein